jgi:hypothetical protein
MGPPVNQFNNTPDHFANILTKEVQKVNYSGKGEFMLADR